MTEAGKRDTREERVVPRDDGSGMRRSFHVDLRRDARLGRWVLAVIFTALCAAATSSAMMSASATVSTPQSTPWTVYHGDATGSGLATSVSSVNTTAPEWTSPALDGQLYGEPLFYSARVYVGTEDNTVYALSSSGGTIVWSTHLGAPVPARSLPCGDITPEVGITGTPVIDPVRAELFVVADELVDGSPHHMLVGLSTTSGQVMLTQDVDPPGADPAALLQRTGLTLDAGQVVFGMGGNYGDCSTYNP